MNRDILVIAHNLRSCHNVGSLFRTAEGLGLSRLYLTGYTPYPQLPDDDRLPHLSMKIDKRITKTSLGAEKYLPWLPIHDIQSLISKLRESGYQIVALEQSQGSIPLPEFIPGDKIAILVGREVEGLEPEIAELCDKTVEIPMLGHKESYNVAIAAAMAFYHCRFS